MTRTHSAWLDALQPSAPRERDRLARVSADRLVPHPPEQIYALLARLENHRHLNDRYLSLERLSSDRHGGHIVIGTPFGLRRTARMTVTTRHEPHRFGGVAAVGARTRARAHWTIEERERGARVALEATVSSASTLDKLLLALGGRWWLRRRFYHVLTRLSDALEYPSP